MSDNVIHTTANHDLFKIIVGNRIVATHRLESLKKSIKEKDLQVPIIVNSNMEVLDGQHRLKAYKDLDLPVRYIIKNDFTIEDVQTINCTTKHWTLYDFVKSFADLNNGDYKTVMSFYEKYEFPLFECFQILLGKQIGFLTLNKIKNGEFKVGDLDTAVVWAERIYSCKHYFPHFRKRDFIRALIFAFNVKEFKWEIYYSRLKNYSLKMHNQADRNDFLIAIQELYNFKTTKKNRIQFDVQPNRSPKKLTYK